MAIKLGCIGDSNTDAYRGTDNRGGSYASITENWLEQLVRFRSADVGAPGSYGEPRRTDYARNWARSASTSDTLLTQGQHTGLAAQLDSSTYAICWIGSNDIRPDDAGFSRYLYSTIYNDSTHAATFYANPIVTDVWTAVDALRAANPAGVILFDYADPNQSPDVPALWPNATNRARVSAVFASINSQLRTGAASRGVSLISWDTHYGEFVSRMIYESGGGATYLTVWGTQIDRAFADEPHNSNLADNHLGTIWNWIVAGWAIDALRGLGADIARAKPYEPFDFVGFTGRPKGSIGRS